MDPGGTCNYFLESTGLLISFDIPADLTEISVKLAFVVVLHEGFSDGS